MTIQVKRVYDDPVLSDGTRVLVDRLWPRGVSKHDAHLDHWLKDFAPSSDLRAWFHKDREERYTEFTTRYKKELTARKAELRDQFAELKAKRVTLITAAKDVEHSHIPTLRAFLTKLQ